MTNKEEATGLDDFYKEFVEGSGVASLVAGRESALIRDVQGGSGTRFKYAAEDLVQAHAGQAMAGGLATIALANSAPAASVASAEPASRTGGTVARVESIHHASPHMAAHDHIVLLRQGETIYAVAEEEGEQRGVNTMTKMHNIEVASGVNSETQAENEPVGFAVHIPAEKAAGTSDYVTVPFGGNLISTAAQNDLSLERLMELNPTYRQNPNFVEAGAHIRIDGPQRTMTTSTHPVQHNHSPSTRTHRSKTPSILLSKPSSVEKPNEPAKKLPKESPSIKSKPQHESTVTPKRHPNTAKTKQVPHPTVTYKSGPSLGSGLHRGIRQAFSGTSLSIAKDSQKLKQDTLHRVASTAERITQVIHLFGNQRHHKSYRASISRYAGECASTGHMFGSTPKEVAMNYFVICQGDSVAQAAGVEGNLMQESSMQSEEIQNGGFSKNPADAGAGGWGIAQWTPGAKASSESRKYGIKGPLYTLQSQLALVSAEMKGQSPTGDINMLKGLKLIMSSSGAAEWFEQHFEEGPIAASGGGQLSNRQFYAREAMSQYNPAIPRALRSQAHWQRGHLRSHHTLGNAAIYYAALQYDSASYQETMIAGHEGVRQWHKRFPHIGPQAALDCSGLVNQAVSTATGGRVNLNENTKTERKDSRYWKKEQYSQVQRGDLIQPDIGSSHVEHVEIVNGVKGNTIYTFGAHTSLVPQPDQVGSAKYTKASGDVFLRYVGPGAPLGRHLRPQTATSTSKSRQKGTPHHSNKKILRHPFAGW